MRFLKQFFPFIVWALAAVCIAPFVSGGAHAGHEEPQTLFQFIWALKLYWFNFLAFSTLMFLLMRNPFKRAWVSRRQSLSERISQSFSRLEESRKTLAQAEQRLASAPEERQRIKLEVERMAVDEAQNIIIAAKARSEGILRSARESAKAEKEAAERKVQNEIAAISLQMAKESLQHEITAESDRPYREAAISEVKQLLQ